MIGDRGGGVGNDRASSGSAISATSEKSVWSIHSSPDDSQLDDERRSDIDWESLERHTVVQLKELLRLKGLPVSGKKEILIERLRSSRDETSVTFSSSSPTDSQPLSLSAARGGGACIGKEATAEEVQADESDAEGGEYASADGGRMAAPETQVPLRERLEARVRDRAAAQRVEVEAARRAKTAGGGGVSASSGIDGRPLHSKGHSSDSNGYKPTSRPVKETKRSIGAGKAMAAPSGRMPLGVLGHGDPRVGNNEGDRIRSSGGANDKQSKPAMKQNIGNTSTGTKNAGGGDHRIVGSMVSSTSATATSAKTTKHDIASKRPGLSRRPGPLSAVTKTTGTAARMAQGRAHGGAGTSGAGAGMKRVHPGVGAAVGTVGSAPKSGTSERARVANEGGDHGGTRVQVDSTKRERVDVGRSKCVVPSFSKPTISSEAQVSAGWQEKSRSGGGGRSGSGGGGEVSR